MTTEFPTSAGFCAQCRTQHTLPMDRARLAAQDLIDQLDREQRLDFHVPPHDANPRLSTGYLFGAARGKMFGVLVCRRPDGQRVVLKAFSGQYNGQWEIKGWAPPLFDTARWHRTNAPAEKEIKNLGVRIGMLEPASPGSGELTARRKKLSRKLMKGLHELYTLNNFRGQSVSLVDAYTGDNGIPNGTADCCGPKLLNLAARKNLRPLGLAEFYYGLTNRQGSRHHGCFYPSCSEKCGPILGFMLCGLEDETTSRHGA